jgi:hypothetical protein
VKVCGRIDSDRQFGWLGSSGIECGELIGALMEDIYIEALEEDSYIEALVQDSCIEALIKECWKHRI